MSYSRSLNFFKYLQLISSFWYSVGHGTNDAQKTMGIIALALVTGGVTKTFELQNWVVVSCYSAIALGTAFGGWRIVKTMGTKITKLRAREGFCAETAAALVLMGTAQLGIPVSTTHVIAGSIMGVGTVEKIGGVRWITARKIVWAWILTIPLTALCAAVSYMLITLIV
jgi:PiT family inorganic phosphate transporter